MKKVKITEFEEHEGNKIMQIPEPPLLYTSPIVFVNGALYPEIETIKGQNRRMVLPKHLWDHQYGKDEIYIYYWPSIFWCSLNILKKLFVR